MSRSWSAIRSLSLATAASLSFGCSNGGSDGDCCSREPGPTLPLASGTVTSATGVEIKVVSNDAATNGMTVSVPAGALATEWDTIAVRASSELPAPLSSEALSAGAIPVSATFSINKESASPFVSLVHLTIPYDKRKVGAGDRPTVLSYDSNSGRYSAVEIEAIDQARGFVTLRTRHFSDYLVLTIPGLYAAIVSGPGATFPPGTQAFDTEFLPNLDGFSVKTFSTQTDEAELQGNCYAVTAYASWYYTEKTVRTAAGRLFAEYRFNDGSDAVQDDVARELIHQVFEKTLFENIATGILSKLPMVEDAETLTQVVTAMLLTGEPQMLSLAGNADHNPLNISVGHSLLAYRWDSTLGLKVYDPGFPGDERDVTYRIGGKLDNYALSGDPNDSSNPDAFRWIAFTTIGTLFSDSALETAATLAQQGWPQRHFNSLTITAPIPTLDPAGFTVYPLDQGAATTPFTLTWNSEKLWEGSKPGINGPITYPRPSYAHVFINGHPSADFLPGAQSVFPVSGRTINISVPSVVPSSAVLEVIISNVNGTRSPAQDAISNGYEGFVRARLTKPSCVSLEGPDWSIRSTIVSQVCDGSMKDSARWAATSVDTLHAYFYQVGCSLYLGHPQLDHMLGTISGMNFSSASVLVLDPEKLWPGIIVAENRLDDAGTISSDLRRIDLSGTGHVSGMIGGVFGSCSIVTSTSWYR
jgi:hypothetical protein